MKTQEWLLELILILNILKLILSLFRLFASFLIGFYLLKLLDKKANPLLLICISLILSGAIGNVIDSVFYGIIYNNAPYNAPFALFNGQVIDMFYIDIWGRVFVRLDTLIRRILFIVMASF